MAERYKGCCVALFYLCIYDVMYIKPYFWIVLSCVSTLNCLHSSIVNTSSVNNSYANVKYTPAENGIKNVLYLTKDSSNY